MKKIAIISAILENPAECQKEFNEVVSSYQKLIRGRLGIPFQEENMAAVSLTVIGTMDEINSFTGKLGKISQVSVKTAVSKKELE